MKRASYRQASLDLRHTNPKGDCHQFTFTCQEQDGTHDALLYIRDNCIPTTLTYFYHKYPGWIVQRVERFGGMRLRVTCQPTRFQDGKPEKIALATFRFSDHWPE